LPSARFRGHTRPLRLRGARPPSPRPVTATKTAPRGRKGSVASRSAPVVRPLRHAAPPRASARQLRPKRGARQEIGHLRDPVAIYQERPVGVATASLHLVKHQLPIARHGQVRRLFHRDLLYALVLDALSLDARERLIQATGGSPCSFTFFFRSL